MSGYCSRSVVCLVICLLLFGVGVGLVLVRCRLIGQESRAPREISDDEDDGRRRSPERNPKRLGVSLVSVSLCSQRSRRLSHFASPTPRICNWAFKAAREASETKRNEKKRTSERARGTTTEQQQQQQQRTAANEQSERGRSGSSAEPSHTGSPIGWPEPSPAGLSACSLSLSQLEQNLANRTTTTTERKRSALPGAGEQERVSEGEGDRPLLLLLSRNFAVCFSNATAIAAAAAQPTVCACGHLRQANPRRRRRTTKRQACSQRHTSALANFCTQTLTSEREPQNNSTVRA